MSAVDKVWWRDAELNCGHMDFQSTALPTELSRQHLIKTGGAGGICSFVSLRSLQRRGLLHLKIQSVLSNPTNMHQWHVCLNHFNRTQLSTYIKLAELTGFEPAISCVTGMCPKPLDDSST